MRKSKNICPRYFPPKYLNSRQGKRKHFVRTYFTRKIDRCHNDRDIREALTYCNRRSREVSLLRTLQVDVFVFIRILSSDWRKYDINELYGSSCDLFFGNFHASINTRSVCYSTLPFITIFFGEIGVDEKSSQN